MAKRYSQLQYFNQLDGCRFLAIASVMLSHFVKAKFIGRLPLGYGVLFFFVLSSFLITRILLNAKRNNEDDNKSNLYSYKQFYIRRSLRIFPIYYLLLIILFIVNYPPCRQIATWLFTYTINLFIGYSHNVSIAGPFSHLWSLAIEEQFYLVYPLLIFSINRKYILHAIMSLVVIGLFGRMFLYLHDPANIGMWNFHSISALDSLGIGGILGYLSIYKNDLLRKIIGNRLLFLLSALLFVGFMIFSFSIYDNALKYNFSSTVFMRFFFNVLSFWVLGWAVVFGYSGFMKTFLENKVIVYLGKISYGLYLYHLFVMYMGNELLNNISLPHIKEMKPVIFALGSIGVASISWYFIEKPINKLKGRFQYNH